MYGTRAINRLRGMPRAAGPATSNLACSSIQETPVGFEPTKSCFAGSRRTVWLRRHHQCPCQESNLVLDLRGVACESGTLQGQLVETHLAEESNLVLQIRSLPCSSVTLARHSSPSRNRTWSKSFGSSRAVRHTHGPLRRPNLESNQDQDLRSVLCCPLHHRDLRADDWIRTSIDRFTKPAPFSVEPRRHSSTSARSRTPCVSFGD